MEQFYSIQGEGYHQGKASYFVRLGGCDVGCPWCDVKESWDVTRHPLITVKEIIDEVKKTPSGICVVTGGEPMMHDLEELTAALHKGKIKTHLETSGAYPLSGKWDWICVSPKRFKAPKAEFLKAAHELKVIIFHRNDLRFAEEYAARVKPACRLYLQPEWSREREVLPWMTAYVKKNPKWEISLQIHKYMNIP